MLFFGLLEGLDSVEGPRNSRTASKEDSFRFLGVSEVFEAGKLPELPADSVTFALLLGVKSVGVGLRRAPPNDRQAWV